MFLICRSFCMDKLLRILIDDFLIKKRVKGGEMVKNIQQIKDNNIEANNSRGESACCLFLKNIQ